MEDIDGGLHPAVDGQSLDDDDDDDMHVFSIFAFAPVQHNWACFTWKGTLEICSLLLLLLLFSRAGYH